MQRFSFRRLLFLSWVIFCSIFVVSCNSVFYQPDDREYWNPADAGLPNQSFYITAADGIKLHLWHLYPADDKPNKGVVLHFHGNAQNMSAHSRFAGWLTQHGYHVVTFDYRGYGKSEGIPDRTGVTMDGQAALHWIRQQNDLKDLPLIVLGQSIGGAIAISSLAASASSPALVVLDSSFAAYRQVAVDVMATHWLTWPFQWLGYVLISDHLSPVDHVAAVKTRWLFIHSQKDPVVPLSSIMALYKKVSGPKDLWVLPEQGHIIAFYQGSPYRQKLIQYLNQELHQ